MYLRAREYDRKFTILRAHAPGVPKTSHVFFVRRGMCFLCHVSLRAHALGRTPKWTCFFRTQGRHSAPRQARPRPGAAPGVLRAVVLTAQVIYTNHNPSWLTT